MSSPSCLVLGLKVYEEPYKPKLVERQRERERERESESESAEEERDGERERERERDSSLNAELQSSTPEAPNQKRAYPKPQTLTSNP